MPSRESLSTTTMSAGMSPMWAKTVGSRSRIQCASLVETVMIARSCTTALRSALLVVDECCEARERLERLGGDVVVLDRDAEALLELEHQLQHGQRVELRQRAEERRRGVDRVRAVLDAEGLDHDGLDGVDVDGGVGLHAPPTHGRGADLRGRSPT